MIDIPITFDEHSRTRIVSYLHDCYTKITDSIDVKKLRNLNCPNSALMLYDLAWMLGVCQSQYSFISINWGDKELQRNVNVLHSTLMKLINERIQNSLTTFNDISLPLNKKIEEVYLVTGIIKKDFVHDSTNKAIPEYWISTNLAVDLLIQHQNTFEEPRKQISCSERLKWGRWEYNKIPDDYCRLTVHYSKEQAQKILEEAEKANLSVFVKVIYSDNTETFTSLTPTEVTAIRNNHPDETNVIIRDFYTNIFKLWVSKNDICKLPGFNSIPEVPRPTASDSSYSITINQHQNKIVLNNYDLITVHNEISYFEASNAPSDIPSSYSGDDINLAVVTLILPELLPNKNDNPNTNKLSWNIFCRLTNVLNNNGCEVEDNIAQNGNSKKKCKIIGIDSKGEEIDLTYEALQHRVKSRLLTAYKYDLKSQKDTFKD